MGVRPVLTVRMTKDARRLIEITVDPVTNARADPLSRDLGAARVGGIPMRECAGHVDKAHSSELIGVFTLAPNALTAQTGSMPFKLWQWTARPCADRPLPPTSRCTSART